MKAIVGLVLAAGFLLAVPGARAQDEPSAERPREDVVSVQVKGLGENHDVALKDALRQAIEKGGRLEVFAQSQTENFALVRDTVLAQATGLVKSYKILAEGEDPLGGYFVQISAEIDRRIIDATWGQVQILLKQMGKPRILVDVVEHINDIALTGSAQDRVEEAGILENKIEQLLVEKGFDLVDKKQIERLKRDRLDAAAKAKDVTAMKQLATELGAQMFIVGSARASGPEIENLYGVRTFMWEADVSLKAIWSETGQILFNRSLVGTRGGSRAPGPPGAKDALTKAGDRIAPECLQAILEKWSRQSVGGGKIVLEVRGLNFQTSRILHDALKQMDGVSDVTRQWQKPVARYEIVAVPAAEQFAETLADTQFGGFWLEIEEQKFNTIQARAFFDHERPVSRKPAATKGEPAVKAGTDRPSPAAAEAPVTPPSAKAPASRPATAPSTRPAACASTTRPAATQPVPEM